MTPETEKYFMALNEMFRSDGWKILMEDMRRSAMDVNSVENAKDEQDLFFRKGQLAVMANILNLETQVANAQQQAEEEDQPDAED